MDTIAALVDRNRVTIDVDGLPYLCHRPSAVLAIEAFGTGALMVVHEGTPEEDVALDPEKVGTKYEVMQKYLTVAMITPRFGKVDDLDGGVISWRSMGDAGPKLYNELLGGTEEEVAAFQESSEVQKE